MKMWLCLILATSTTNRKVVTRLERMFSPKIAAPLAIIERLMRISTSIGLKLFNRHRPRLNIQVVTTWISFRPPRKVPCSNSRRMLACSSSFKLRTNRVQGRPSPLRAHSKTRKRQTFQFQILRKRSLSLMKREHQKSINLMPLEGTPQPT